MPTRKPAPPRRREAGDAEARFYEASEASGLRVECAPLRALSEQTGGQTVADVLDLIRLAPEEEKLLRAFAEKFPDLKSNVERSLDYRLGVEKEFCRLACGMGAPRPEDSMSAVTMQL